VIGADTSVILRRLEEHLATYKPDMVVAMMGFNDRRIVYYDDIPEAGTPLFQHCKAYRLLRLLSIRLAKKFKNTVDPNPKNIQAYRSLLRVYLSQGKISAAEKTLRQGIEHDSRNDCLYVEMAEFYWRQGNLLRAEEALQRLLILSPHSDFAHRTIEDFYRKTNRIELAGKYKERREELRLNEYRAATVKNYRKLKEILDALKIRLVCAQYPMRNLEPLKGVFAGENSIVFVDNEKIFKDAVEKVNYQEYFRDKFGGDFGHCTEKGNRLLAENIANTILREVFGK
jgi:tetratricopeptide (TPR) repeat protein